MCCFVVQVNIFLNILSRVPGFTAVEAGGWKQEEKRGGVVEEGIDTQTALC